MIELEVWKLGRMLQRFLNLFRKQKLCQHEMIYYNKKEGLCIHGQVITRYQTICRLCGMIPEVVHISGHEKDCTKHVGDLLRIGCAAKQKERN